VQLVDKLVVKPYEKTDGSCYLYGDNFYGGKNFKDVCSGSPIFGRTNPSIHKVCQQETGRIEE
jgi:hypothetical protein